MYSTQEMSGESLKEEKGGNASGNTDLVKKKLCLKTSSSQHLSAPNS